MKRTNIYLTDSQEEAIAKIIKDDGGRTKAEHVRNAIDRYIYEYKPPYNDGFYFQKKYIDQCLVEDGEEPSLLLEGKENESYILSIDDSYSSSPCADYFSMSVIKISENNKQPMILVHNYAKIDTLENYIKYFNYILQSFNIKLIITDNPSVFINNALESSFLNKDIRKRIKSVLSESNENELNYLLYLSEINTLVKNNYIPHINIAYTSQTIRQINEFLQICFVNKEILFGSRLLLNKNYKELEKTKIDYKLLGYNNIHDFIYNQDDLRDLVRKQCLCIEVRSSATNNLIFDLPAELKRNISENRMRKDSYQSLLLGCWGGKIYNSLKHLKQIKEIFNKN